MYVCMYVCIEIHIQWIHTDVEKDLQSRFEKENI